MPNKFIQNVKILGIAAAVPPQVIDNQTNKDFPSEEVEKIVASTGVVERRVAPANVCSSDLCYAAAEKLLNEFSCERGEIDIIVFVSQTPDHILPATACILQKKLNLKKEVMAFDINLGCSGYTYGLIVLATLLSSGLYKKALLLAGDTISKVVSPQDRSVAFLFGDAGSATLLEYNQTAARLYFDFGTDGSGFDKLMIEGGAFRNFYRTNLYMNGADIFSFTLREVPKTIHTCLQVAGIHKEEIDFFFFHQANVFMLNHLIKKMGLDETKVPMSLQEYGNTSVASIPLTMCLQAQKFSAAGTKKVLLAGFGVGFSWATVIADLSDIQILPPIELTAEDLA